MDSNTCVHARRKIDFKNTIIIMTSNLGADVMVKEALDDTGGKDGGHSKETRDTIHHLLRHKFSPEFVNRVDEIVLFNRLSRAHLVDIVDLRLADARQRLADRHVGLQVDDMAKQFMAKLGYDPAFGARPLQRVIQKLLLNPVSYPATSIYYVLLTWR